jgi:hypothetical protein
MMRLKPLRSASRALGIKHRAAVPTKHRVEIAPNTQPVYLHDSSFYQCRGGWIANRSDAHERRAIEDAEPESPSPRWVAVLVVAGDKSTGGREGYLSNPQLIIQDGSVTLIVIDPAELVASEVFRAEPPERFPAPKRIGLHFERNAFKQA